ncbi:MAG: pentapeptide repeat-containing protein [Dermatophilaceae bacterium]
MAIHGYSERASFAGADLRQRTFDGRSFKMCDFRGADLRGASLRGCHFAGCDLRDADLRWADLTEAEFTYVMTHSPDHGRTDVSGVRWEGARLERVTTDRVIGWPSN